MYDAFNQQVATGDLLTPPDVSNRLLAYWTDGNGYYKWKEEGGVYPQNNGYGKFLSRVDEDGAWGTVRKLVTEEKYETNKYYGLSTDAMNSRQGVLNKMTEETFTKMVMGETPTEEFGEYRKKWLELGGQEIIDEVNQWYSKNQ